MPPKMIKDPETYFSQFTPDRDPLLTQLEKEAKQEGIPIIGPFIGELLYLLVKATKAKNILELGSAIGYSTIYLAKASKEQGGKVITIDHSPGLVERAKLNFQKAGLENQIQIHLCNSLDEMQNMQSEYFDFIFMDIDKEFYLQALDLCSKITKKGGLLVVDNIAFKDADPFNKAIAKSSDWRAIPLFGFFPFHSPEQDGIYLAVKR